VQTVVEAPVADLPPVVVAEPVAVVVAEPVAVAAAAPAPVLAAPVELAPQPFVLPIDTLHTIAQAGGLEWVNSDADKVRAVQAAIAAQPKPVHVPREPRPIIVLDDGPLVLVETRRDLAGMTLPFETSAPAQPVEHA
jgi:ribonuclease E